MTGRLWRLAVTAPDEPAADGFAAVLGAVAPALTAFESAPGGEWLVQGFVEGRPERGPLEAGLALAAAALGLAEPALAIEPVEEIDWLKANQESFPPMRIGRYVIQGSHVRTPVPAGAVGLLIDAATAFGTGEHPTTHGCLLALDRLARRGRRRRILDMGSGTGILAMAAARTFRVPVLAADIDAHAVAVARENVKANGLAGRVRAIASDGYAAREIAARAPYDLIFANILARPLGRMAPALARHLAPGGVAILSGLLGEQEPLVASAHRAQGLAFAGRIRRGNWHTLVFRKGSI